MIEYQKIANLLDNDVELSVSNLKFKTTMLRSNLCDYADAYIPGKGTIRNTSDGKGHAAK